MKAILSSAEMKACDKNTIEKHGLSSGLLMERAACTAADYIREKYPEADKLSILCGPGNNGGDGVALGRILFLRGYDINIQVIGDEDKFSQGLKDEIQIAKSYDINITYGFNPAFFYHTDLLVDAMFGIGLSRGLTGEFLEAANYLNKSDIRVLSLDIPSGYSSDNGKCLGQAGVQADDTVTFSYMKKGLVLGECKEACGNVFLSDAGIYLDDDSDCAKLLDDSILEKIPQRSLTSNKGSNGKVLVIAGSKGIYGACYLSAKAAMVSGAGMVKVYTHTVNLDSLRLSLPEAMYTGYESFDKDQLTFLLDWADVVLIGPGLGSDHVSREILQATLSSATCPLVIDADGINILSEDLSLLERHGKDFPLILTPHLKEMERLCGKAASDINYSMEETAKEFVDRYPCTLLLKNHTSLIASRAGVFYCTSGNQALATAGSGDVLAGITASLMAQGLETTDCACAAAYIHGKAGSLAAKELGIKGVLASNIISRIKL
ncbi:MAG: NAD(P)H-hydrate dehydratase [Pseudobutyrivibrio sp.]|nr:NAD(P)H-hydrate dehydratase [Pseudobutyrivibrio sp.]